MVNFQTFKLYTEILTLESVKMQSQKPSFDICRVGLEIVECGAPGLSEGEEKQKVGVLRQKFFEVDRAFIYFVWDYFTGTITLIGRVTTPVF